MLVHKNSTMGNESSCGSSNIKYSAQIHNWYLTKSDNLTVSLTQFMQLYHTQAV